MGCFKPKIPKAVPNPDATIQRMEMEAQGRDTKAANKQARLEATLAGLSGKMGRNSLFTGMGGGAGYAAPLARSLFVEA